MKTQRIRIISVDVVKVDFARRIAFLAYTLRAAVGDNHSATDVGLESAEKMCDELFEAARGKAGILAEAFTGTRPNTERYQVADYKATRDRVLPLFRRILEARRRFEEGSLSERDRTLIETDGVHLLRPEMDLDGRGPEERAEILIQRARRHLEQSDPEPARLMAQRALRLRPDDPQARDVLARCT